MKARKLIEAARDPDSVEPKSYVDSLPDPRIVKMELLFYLDEPLDETEMPDFTRDVSEALYRHARETGYAIEPSVASCKVMPVQPARGSPAGWDLDLPDS
jgi:hypothetical protein